MRIAFAALALVAGCSTVTSGRVESKAYDPPYEIVTPTCFSYSPQGICTVNVPIVHHYPECWRLDLVNADVRGSVCVSHDEWAETQLGDRYNGRA